jgi:phosphate:Na+ symporter
MLLFVPISLFTPFVSAVESVSPNGSVQVAAGHIVLRL